MAAGKLTLLSVVQKTLEALGSDTINAIGDSPEAEQIAQMAEDSYYDLLNQHEWPWLKQLTVLESIADAARPTYLKIPSAVTRIDQFKYYYTDEVDPDVGDLALFRNIQWLEPMDFVNYVQARNTQSTDVQVMTTFQGIRLPIINTESPTYWTSFDDKYVICDSFDSGIESTLEGNRSQVLAKVIPDFTMSDTFMPDAPPQFFQAWMNDVISTAFQYMRQEAAPVADRKSRRGLAVLRRDASITSENDGKVHFGRRVV
jgi:hypothetical protein